MTASPTLFIKTLLRHRLVRSLIFALACLQASQCTVLIVALWGVSPSRPAYQALVLSSVLIAIAISAMLTSRSHCRARQQAGPIGTRLRIALGYLFAGMIALYAAQQSVTDVLGYTQPLENGGWPLGELYATLAIGLLLALMGAVLLLCVVLIQWLDRYLDHRKNPGRCSA